MTEATSDTLASLRRAFHAYPEPGWCEFYTTCRLVEEIERIGVDECAVGRDAMKADERMAVPSDERLDEWFGRAKRAGAREDLLERCRGGYTGAVAVLERGDGPVVGLRVDIDALEITESDAGSHAPASEGFRSENEGVMHACGHDAHVTIGLGVLEAITKSDFAGTLKVIFQPAEELSGGGKAMAESAHLDDVEYLFAVHVGLDHPTGTVVAGVEKPLAMAHLTATFTGESAHAGKAPNEGSNAMQAMATAVQSAYAIPRHADGMTRVNFGRVEGGSASNVIADEVTLHGEVRGETTDLMVYTQNALDRRLLAAAEMHDCEVTPEVISESPRADSDDELRSVVAAAAEGVDGVEAIRPTVDFGASEDATFLMDRVQRNGGYATYLIVGADHPTSHHTPTFDVDERSIPIAVDVLTASIEAVAAEPPA
ncbi:amidohydrolase (plasmid) [Haloferacaceae archaeon DSL9]